MPLSGDERRSERLLHLYDPWLDIELRHPDWRVEIIDCEAGEEFYPDAKLVLVKTDYFIEDPEGVLAHVAVHLDEHQGEMGEQMTEEQEDHANAAARFRLDREGLR
jgi:hypothetical protein